VTINCGEGMFLTENAAGGAIFNVTLGAARDGQYYGGSDKEG
jgi:hypothetical protein